MKKDATSKPPLFARRAFEWWSKKADAEDLLGDIDEYYQFNLEDKGRLSAKFIYFKQVLSLSFSYALRKRKRSASYSNYYSRNSFAMIKNYFKIALRNFSKHKLFTSINILGLALGMSISLLALSLFVTVFKFDEFHAKKNRIFQINTHITEPDDRNLYGSTFNAVGEYMEEKYPFVEQVLQIKPGFNPEIKHQGNLLNFNGYFVGPSFFNMFSFQLISGDPVTALSEPFSIVLTKSAAKKLYRNENPIGKVIETENGSFNVTGVMDDLRQTHLYFEMLTSFKTYEQLNPRAKLTSDWINYRNNYVYLLLKDTDSRQALSTSLKQVSTKAEEFNPDRKIELR
ncbi:MAG: ABC transporter permease, partial [Cyclobacteriaceae bacterium]